MSEHRTYEGWQRRSIFLLVLALAAVVGLSAWDIAADLQQGAGVGHLLTEGLLLFSGLVGLALVGARYLRLNWQKRALERQAHELTQKLESVAKEAARWRAEARHLLEGLSKAIDEQFERWRLTAAEKDIALLLLKGLSHKEIAAIRHSSEATVRQQARAIYKKSSLQGRSELSAFFLEDLLLPQDSDGRGPINSRALEANSVAYPPR